MKNNSTYTGYYYFMGMVLNVQEVDGALTAAVPGVPAGYEIRLEPLGSDRFLLHGGTLDKSEVVFKRSTDGKVLALRSGNYELVKVPPERLGELPVAERLLPPDFTLTAAKEAAFENLLKEINQKADGGWVDYNLPYPKHEFVQYLMLQDQFIFHGSNNLEIETFAPVRKSVELGDETGRGNLQAVYGTHDGLWSMFFAVVDRARLRGSIRNGVMYFHNRAGARLAVYNFSINQEQLSERPWREGALYFLPRDTFVRLKLSETAYANEWASEAAVHPIARLRLQPEDFPFLEVIGGHDDGQLIRLQTLEKAVREAARAAALSSDRFTAVLPPEMGQQLDEYIQLQRIFMPAARFVIKPLESGFELEITSLPPAFRQGLADGYRALLGS